MAPPIVPPRSRYTARMLLAALPLLAAGFGPGERLAWTVTWMGIEAGEVTATVAEAGDAWAIEVASRSARWLEPLYPIDDRLVSVWDPATGSRAYTTRFREGRFHQDQRMRFGPDAIVVWRNQRFDDGWRAWEDRYDAAPGVEDPVSALYRLRAAPLAEETRFPVFSGRQAIEVVARLGEREAVGGVPAWPIEVTTEHRGDVRGRLRVWLSDDAARVPLRAVVETRAGDVTLRLRDD